MIQPWCYVYLTEEQTHKVLKEFIPSIVGWSNSDDEIISVSSYKGLTISLTSKGSVIFSGKIEVYVSDGTAKVNKTYDYSSKPFVLPNYMLNERINRAAWEKKIPTFMYNDTLKDEKVIVPGELNESGERIVYALNFRLTDPIDD